MKYGITKIVNSNSCSSRLWINADPWYKQWTIDPAEAQMFDSIKEALAFKCRYGLFGFIMAIH